MAGHLFKKRFSFEISVRAVEEGESEPRVQLGGGEREVVVGRSASGDYCLQPIGRSHVRSDQGLVLHVVVKTSRLRHSLVIPLHVVIVRHRRHLPQHAFGIHQYLLHHRLQAL